MARRIRADRATAARIAGRTEPLAVRIFRRRAGPHGNGDARGTAARAATLAGADGDSAAVVRGERRLCMDDAHARHARDADGRVRDARCCDRAPAA